MVPGPLEHLPLGLVEDLEDLEWTTLEGRLDAQHSSCLLLEPSLLLLDSTYRYQAAAVLGNLRVNQFAPVTELWPTVR